MVQLENKINKKRIAKNTIALYIRQLLSIIISIYTVRIVLRELGEIDYGIYNVVGGVVLLFSFISHSMASATQRYLSMSIPSGIDKVRKMFSDSLWIYLAMILFVAIISETIGVWVLNSFLQIPNDRLTAANCVLQCTIISFLMTFFASPFFALIITYEKMEIFAMISIVEAIMKLIVAMSFSSLGHDKLMVYSFLILLVTALTQGYYVLYCKKHYNEVLRSIRLEAFHINKNIKDMLVFAFWTLFRTVAVVVKGQGVNILLNVFYGPIVNAARGIAYQIENSLTNVLNAIYMAARPQIFQLYKKKQISEMFSLVYMSSKIAFYLQIIIFSILYYRTDFIIGKWLGDVPQYTVIFIRLTLINCCVEVLIPPIVNIIHANGNIGRIQLITSIITILIIPISYVFLNNGSLPMVVYLISIIISFVTLIVFISYARETVNLSIRKYLRNVIIPITFVVALSQIPLCLVNSHLEEQTWKSLIFFCIVAFIWLGIVIFSCGLSVGERQKVSYYLKQKMYFQL